MWNCIFYNKYDILIASSYRICIKYIKKYYSKANYCKNKLLFLTIIFNYLY